MLLIVREGNAQIAQAVVEGVPVHERKGMVEIKIKIVKGAETAVSADPRARTASNESTTVRVVSVITSSEAIRTIRRNTRRTDPDLARETNAMCIELIFLYTKTTSLHFPKRTPTPPR